ncbi:hypothetical protein MPH_00554 [Macrophomina phaseolina MS6]|uniref:Uncharacterized protein n=1 Tax=Macrophomina phaseolina (strain MS6) TaxID=1126212 RepID=K2SI24_MACPH|nr:hypothetical protein MPH_00554 [Macrophomina phaseolina MS6]
MQYAKGHSPPITPAHAKSNPALGSMEQTIPSFRDFMKTSPPSNPPQLKPLPPLPQPRGPSAAPFVPSHSSSMTAKSRTSRSGGYLKATIPAWESDEETPAERALETANDFFLQPATYTVSNPALSKPNKKELSVLEPRKFALLIPDPSPQTNPPVLTPAFEYETHMDFPPSPDSSKPPQTPLPPIPSGISPAKRKDLSRLRKTTTPPSPAPSGDAGAISPNAALSKTSLAISPFSLATPVSPSRQWSNIPQSPPWSRDISQYVQQSSSSKSLRRLVPRSAVPGADEEWEDIEGARPVCQDWLSTDYHTALVEQYRDLVLPSTDIFADDKRETFFGPAYNATNVDEDLVPQPLSLQSELTDRYDIVDRSSPFPEDHYELPPQAHQQQSSIRGELPALTAGTLNMILPSQHSRKSSATSSRSGEIHVSPPANHDSFHEAVPRPGPRPTPKQRPRGRAFPIVMRPQSGVYAVKRAKPVLKSVEEKKNSKKEKGAPP